MGNIFAKNKSSNVGPDIGIEISAETMRFVSLHKKNNGVCLKSFGTQPFTQENLTKIRTSNKLQSAAVCLSKETNIPQQSEGYLSMLRKAGFKKITTLSTDLALVRSIIPDISEESSAKISTAKIIIDFGRQSTKVTTIVSGIPDKQNSFVADFGFLNLIKNISSRFDISETDAEWLIQKIGLSRDEQHLTVHMALVESLVELMNEIDKLYICWHQSQQNLKNEQKDYCSARIENMLLVGESANLPGLAGYFSKTLRLPVTLANIWINVPLSLDYIPEIPFADSLSYAAAIGLALGQK